MTDGPPAAVWGRVIAVVALLVGATVAGCGFDGPRQSAIRYPVTLVIRNGSPRALTLTGIHSDPAAMGAFTLATGTSLPPGESREMKVSEAVFDDLDAGHFFIDGRCGGMSWRKHGSELPHRSVETSSQWEITIDIEGVCEQ